MESLWHAISVWNNDGFSIVSVWNNDDIGTVPVWNNDGIGIVSQYGITMVLV